MVSAEPGINLSELVLRTPEGMSRDDIYALIANRELYVDLREAPLPEPAAVRVFANREAAEAWCHVAVGAEASLDHGGRGFAVKAGHKVTWDGRSWTVVNVGDEIITLLGEDQTLTELPVSVLEQLAREGRIEGSQAKREFERRPEVAALAAANEEDLTEANRRFGAVLWHFRGEPPPGNGEVSPRTLRSWVARYRKAAACLGSGYLGLLPRHRQRGNRSSRLSEATRTMLVESIEHDYETLKQKTRFACWAVLKARCEARKSRSRATERSVRRCGGATSSRRL